MFRFNQKRANREADEVKRLLSIMKGIKKSGQSNLTYLKEDEDPTLNIPVDASAEAPADAPVDTPEDKALPNPTPEENAKTTEQKDFEKATNGTKVTEMSDKIVKGEKFNGKLEFTYDVGEDKKPTVKISDELELDDDAIATLQKIKEYYPTWKGEKKKEEK
jgi:predicted  nucleic acid-binding Zn-ribbon protein